MKQTKLKSLKNLVMLVCLIMILCTGSTTVSAVTVTTQKKTITASTKKHTMVKGEKLYLYIKGYSGSVKWKSSNKKIVTVGARSILAAKAKGTVTLTGTYGKKTLTLNVTVQAPKLSVTSTTLTVGRKKQLRLSGTTQTVKWKTSRKTIATVTSKGLVTAKKAGTSTITATVLGVEYTCKVKVVKKGGSTSPSITPTATLSPTPKPTATPTPGPTPLAGAVSTPADLLELRRKDGSYYLVNDLDLRGGEWYCVEYFDGVFDGRGHTIYVDGRTPVFRYLNGTIKNLTIENSVIMNREDKYWNFFEGYYDKSRIENVEWTGSIEFHNRYFNSVICPFGASEIINCRNHCKVVIQNEETPSVSVYISGIGSASRFIKDCVYDGEITVTNDLPNIAGIGGVGSSGYMEKCLFNSKISLNSCGSVYIYGVTDSHGCEIKNSVCSAELIMHSSGSGWNQTYGFGYGMLTDCLFIGKGPWAFGLNETWNAEKKQSSNCVCLGECEVPFRGFDPYNTGSSVFTCYHLESAINRHWGNALVFPYSEDCMTHTRHLKDEERARISAYPTLDFTNTWIMTSEGPRLRAFMN